VIPGNILYKQRGTIWHAGENTILGRDHTIHAAVAGYVKYYRDPARHPKRQYIGVTFNRDDKLPYPPNAPRIRRLGMVAVQRKPEAAPQPTLSRSGIPFAVVRKPELPTAAAAAPQPSDPAAAASSSSSPPAGNPDPAAEVKAAQRTKRQTAKQRKADLAALRVAQRRIQKETRVLHLQSDYSYREHNWEIGRLVGIPGQVQGAGKTRSRKNMLRVRRRKRQITFGTLKNEARKRRERTLEAQRKAAEKRARREAEVKEEAAKAAKAKGDGAGAGKTPA
jgi:protein phosphatase inhibitor 2